MVMRRYAAAILLACAIGPASALDLGVGNGSVGANIGAQADVGGVAGADVGVSAGAGDGSVGANIGAQADVGGVAGADVGVSAGAGDGSIGAGTSIGGTGAGVSAGVDTGGASSSGGGSANTAGGSRAKSSGSGGAATARSGHSATGTDVEGTTMGIGPTKGAYAIVLPRTLVPRPIILPRSLRPSTFGRDKLGRGDLGSPLLARIVAKPGTPQSVVRVCRQSIVSAATPLGAVRVYAASAGSLRRERRGVLVAPIAVRIHYQTQGGVEVRQARTQCRLDGAGRVIALK